GYIMTVDGMPIRTGIYISFQQTSMNNASEKLSELDSDDSDDSGNSDSADSSDTESEKTSIFDRTIDGMSVSDWVKEDTRKGIKRFVSIFHQCDQYNITLTDDELTKINNDIQENWNTTSINYYGYTFTVEQIYGYKSMGDYYTAQGIGMDSLKEISTANALSNKLFMYYYGEGGSKAVPSDEIDKYLEENSVAYKLITFNYRDFRGDPVVGDEKDDIIERAKSYAERYNNGAKFIDILYDFDLLAAQNKARAEAEEYYEASPQEGYTLEEYMDMAAGKATAEKGESDEKYDEVIFNDSGILSDELMDFIKEAPEDGKAAVYEGTTSAYLIIRNPISEFPNWKTNNLEDVLKELRGEEFDTLMDDISKDYTVDQKDSLVNGKYAPEKLNK
ncbi:MAG: hypothetical protein K2N56_06875, partial [Oscillospiraceae bacterium]|nr:hypothetical protein [Oscillospiraceae bacterium]